MLFSSIVFLFTFLPAVMLLYYLLPVRFRNVILLLASLVFYAWGEPVYLFLMLLSILFNYFSGLDIARNLQDKRAAKRSLVFNLIINLAVLGFFKYEGFVLDTLNGILPVHISYHALPLPIGISFYTFQILSYIIDVYRGNVKVQTNLPNFALYVTMFPQLIAGPIVQYADVDEQLASREISRTKFGEGSMYFIRGLAKKVLLANTSGMIFTEVSGLAKGNIAVMTAWLGAFAYMFQIYFDFSGYSDMAIGIALLLGFRFNVNFDSPYQSATITEFWRRWHISLSSWLKDYLYISLGGNRKGKIRTYINLLITMLLGGLWHGASVSFILWGALHGVALAVHKFVMNHFSSFKPLGSEMKPWRRVIGVLITFHLVCFGWILFRADSMQTVGEVLTQIFTNFHPEVFMQFVVGYKGVFVLMVVGYILHFMPKSAENGLQAVVTRSPLLVQAVMLAIAIFVVVQFKSAGVQPFIYFQF